LVPTADEYVERFVTEGVRRRARKLDGQYDDNVVMALIGIEEEGPAA
jgi:hypothetical protein